MIMQLEHHQQGGEWCALRLEQQTEANIQSFIGYFEDLELCSKQLETITGFKQGLDNLVKFAFQKDHFNKDEFHKGLSGNMKKTIAEPALQARHVVYINFLWSQSAEP